MDLKNKIVVITGSSSGIGKSTALEFAKQGAKIVINYRRNSTEAQKTVEEIKKLGSDAVSVKADVSDPAEVKTLFTVVLKRFGTVDILINNAGLAKAKPFLEITKDDLTNEFSENFFGQVYCSQEAAKIMMKNGGGKILNIASICGMERSGCGDILTYTSAKAAVITFTRTLAKVLAPKITVNAVAPGFTLTRYWNGTSKQEEQQLLDLTLLKKWVKPEEIAKAFLYLASNDSVTGEVLVVDGGYTIK